MAVALGGCRLSSAYAIQGSDPFCVLTMMPYSAWKPLVNPVQDNPITLCDYFSTEEKDLVTIEYHPTPQYAGEYYSLRYNEAQRWYWLSNQTAEELLLFLSYDSHPTHGVKCEYNSPHSSARTDTTTRLSSHSIPQPSGTRGRGTT